MISIFVCCLLMFANVFSFNQLVVYNGCIEHLFTHCLIIDDEVAFSSKNNLRKDLLRDCITSNEFELILEQLYENDYMLIDIKLAYHLKDNGAIKSRLLLPKGKKPLILSFDDVNYDHKKQGKGMADKLIVADKKVKALISKNGQTKITENEFVTMLDKFVAHYPNFSFNNAKGIINVTGYDGILGYRTQSKNIIDREQQIIEAKKVVSALKNNGWQFACHSFGHYHMKRQSVEHFKNDVSAFVSEVVPIIGKTDIYVYPYGEWEIGDSKTLSDKHNFLIKQGFKLFCGVGMQPFFSYLPYNHLSPSLFMDRVAIDGYSLTYKKDALSRLFDADKVLDSRRDSVVAGYN